MRAARQRRSTVSCRCSARCCASTAVVPIRGRLRALRNTKPPVGQALTDEEQQRLFAAARSDRSGSSPTSPRRSRSTAACARARSRATVAARRLGPSDEVQIRRSKTPAGWRDPSLNGRACVRCGSFDAPRPWDSPSRITSCSRGTGENKKIDPTRPIEPGAPRGDQCGRRLACSTCDSTTAVTPRSRALRGGTSRLGDPGADGSRRRRR